MDGVEIVEFIPNVYEKPQLTITSDKFNHSFTVKPTNDGFVFYCVNVTKGNVPNALKGNYSTMRQAKEAVLEYIRLSKPSQTVERDKKAKIREERKEKAEG